ncbi:hydrolase 76 protein [Puccinia graminis f. sp. tritici]|uniref:Mannan endo-1,6-alpha-mannosidase n=1 Tax=Puccinia graminis f. sp. tritici TaxID=56615 RepID=A0A5B0QAW0_PUCGR|nr:hydrolase 76 protein [Puccinia graminis f. sp. tritici]
MRGLSGIISIALVSISATDASPEAPSVDVHNIEQLTEAACAAMGNLMSYFTPNPRGTFNETDTPWHESGMIWGLNFDYARWTGDTRYLDIVTQALVHQSNDELHDFLSPGVKEQWNDDILWPAQAGKTVVAAAELYGPSSTLPNSTETWINLANKTYQEAASQTDDKCGGGIYWYRDRSAPRGSYKALITHSEFISQGARNYMITKDPETLEMAKSILEWVISSGIANPKTGLLMDGLSINNCTDFTTFQWSYNYGQWLGSLAWMHKATGDQKYLDMATPYFDYSQRTFAASNTSGIISELCEPDGSCNRDQKGFKAIYARNLAYLHRETNNSTMKRAIEKVIHTSVQAMAAHSCDKDWNCAGIWTTDAHPIKYVRAQHVSAALLVAAVGIHGDGGLDASTCD